MDTSKLQRKDLLLIAYQVFAAIIIAITSFSGGFTNGPCNLGIGSLLFLLIILVQLVLLLMSVFLLIKSKSNKYFMIINLFATALWIAVLFIL